MSSRTPAKDLVEKFKEIAASQQRRMTELALPSETLRQLEAECSPIPPEAYYGIPITVLPDEPTRH